jgi:hypothetical protein
MSSARSKKTVKSFVARVLDGDTRLDGFAAEVRAWQAGEQKQPLHEALGLDADELLLVAKSPDSLRYLMYDRRFERAPSGRPAPQLDTQARVDAHAMQLAAVHTDLFLLAEIEEWRSNLARSNASRHVTAHA